MVLRRFSSVLIGFSCFSSVSSDFWWFLSIFLCFRAKWHQKQPFLPSNLDKTSCPARLRVSIGDWDAETGLLAIQEVIWCHKTCFARFLDEKCVWRGFWSILDTAPDHRGNHDISQMWPNALEHAFPSGKSFVFHCFESFCLSLPTTMLFDLSKFDGFGPSDALFMQKASKTRFRASNQLLAC